MHAFSKELYDSMGVRVFIFGCYAKPDGTLDVSTYNFNRELGNGKDYIDMQGQRFQEHGMTVSSWRAHNEEYYGSEDLTSADGGHQRGRATMTLEKNSYGEPILPDPSKPPMRSSTDVRKWRLNILRAFINQHYSEPRPTDLPLLILKLCIYLDLAAGQQKGSAPWMAIGAKLLDYVDEEYIPDAWRTETTEGDNVYKFQDPSKFPTEMVTQGLQFWYQRQERGKVAFRFKSFLEGKGIQEAPPRRKLKVYNVGKGSKSGKRSKGQRKRRAATESPSEDEATIGKGKKPSRSKGQRSRADTESGSDEEARPKQKGVANPKFNAWVDSDVGTESGSDEEAGPRMKTLKSKDRWDSTESGSENEARPERKKSVEGQKTVSWEGDDESNVPSSGGNVKQMANTGPTKSRAEDPTPARVTDVQRDSDNLSAGNGSYWEANLGDQSGGGKKRKRSDDEDTPPPKVSRLETVYKLGPRNGPPGKIKKSVGFSMGVQDLVQQDLKPVSFGNAFTKQGSNEVAPQAGRSHPRTPIDFVTSVNSVTVKPKPRPRPIKGKVSTELGIVTRDRSKKIAEESVRTTRSKKHLV